MHIVHQSLANATDIHKWADWLVAQGSLPKLIRKLIQASTPDLISLDMPDDEGIQKPGSDGITNTTVGNAFVPQGQAYWEMGTSSKPGDKANGDYKKRTKLERSQEIFVFVTPRRWPGKEKWLKTQRDEEKWREVRAYDADDLSTWLESAPAVHIGFSELIGKHVEGMETLEEFAKKWCQAAQPAIPEQLVTSGREEKVSKVRDCLNEPAKALSVATTSREEAILFLFATLKQSPELESQLARAVIVRNVDAWNFLSRSKPGLLLILYSDELENVVTAAVQKGHHVLIPLVSDKGDIVLPLLRREPVEKLLIEADISEERATRLSLVARRSLVALQRQMSPSKNVSNPAWSRTPSLALLSAMLIGEWDGNNQHDREVLEQLSRMSYRDFEHALLELKILRDPPVRQRNNIWMIAVKTDAWMLLSGFITQDWLKQFREICNEVLGVSDPALELPKDQRMMKVLQHSQELRHGLADTLAVMAALSDDTKLAGGLNGQYQANLVVRSLLLEAPLEIWTSVSNVLPLLAEASPTFFLEAVKHNTRPQQPLLAGMFTDIDYHYTGLLWALEGLAWDPDYLGDAALALLRLNRLDPGGTMSNRPMDSLKRIFLSWHPCTLAPISCRMQVLETLAKSDREATWTLQHLILPYKDGTIHSTSKPKHRDWSERQPALVTNGEILKADQEIVRRLVKDARLCEKHWKALLEVLTTRRQQDPVAQECITTALEALKPDQFSTDDRNQLWEALIEETEKQHADHGETWVLPDAILERLDAVTERFQPTNLVQRFSRLFSGRTKWWIAGKTPHEQYEYEMQRRIAALDELHADGGLPAIYELIERAAEPLWVGLALARTDYLEPTEDAFLKWHINGEQLPFQQVAQHYVTGRLFTWVEQKVQDVLPVWAVETRAGFLVCLNFERCVWEMVEHLGAQTEQHYWQTVNVQVFTPNQLEDLQFVIEHLLPVKRPYSALQLLSPAISTHTPMLSALAVQALQACLQEVAETRNPELPIYDVSIVLDALEQDPSVPRETLEKLELAFLPAFRDNNRIPKVLHQKLANSPKFFAELVEARYKPESDEQREPTEENRALATIVWTLLDNWTTHLPGMTRDGETVSIDLQTLKTWIATARAETEQRDRTTMGLHVIAEMLARAPTGTATRSGKDVLKELDAKVVPRAFHTSRYNQRGMTSRGLLDGGNQERDLADWYKKQSAAVMEMERWPKTAAILKRLESTYRTEAQEQDSEAETNQEK